MEALCRVNVLLTTGFKLMSMIPSVQGSPEEGSESFFDESRRRLGRQVRTRFLSHALVIVIKEIFYSTRVGAGIPK